MKKSNPKFLLLLIILICFFVFVGYIWGNISKVIHFSNNGVLKKISKNLGEPMITDEFGNVNVLVIGHGGNNWQGGYLADTIMVASWNPDTKVATLLSIPRDLYVKYSPLKYRGKINGVFGTAYLRAKYQYRHTTGDVERIAKEYGSEKLIDMVENITNLKIPYFIVIDFQGFVDFIDSIGGIDIDVPYKLVDNYYPDGKGGYMTLIVNSGFQHMDGQKALKYARSRHTTSDFSRAERQQLIIEAVIQKLSNQQNLKNINNIKKLYDYYKKYVTTNISLGELIWLASQKDNLQHYFSFVLHSDCDERNLKYVSAGCFLYVPPRAEFNGASVLLPDTANPANTNVYDEIHKFVFLITHYQKYLVENLKIEVLNGIDSTEARKMGYISAGQARKFAVKLKKYGFNVVSIDNHEEKILQNTAYIGQNVNEYKGTLDALKYLTNLENVFTGMELATGVDLDFVLGLDYFDFGE